MFKTITALGAAALAACAFCSPAAASPADEDQRSLTVSYGDLNIATPGGAARLDQRIRAAASQVCGHAGSYDLFLNRMVAECRSEAYNRAKASVEIAMRSGGSRVVALRTN